MAINQINPALPRPIYTNKSAAPQTTQQQRQTAVAQTLLNYSPAIQQFILAQSKQILPAQSQTQNVQAPQAVNQAQNAPQPRQNNLRQMLTSNQANIFAVIPRTMNAQDLDGNELIQGNEKSGTLVNAVERLDEIKNLGYNTLHILPIHPPGKTHAMGTSGSLYAPALLVEKDGTLAIDPEIVDENPPEAAKKRIEEIYEQKTGKKLVKMDKNDPDVRYAQMKYFNEECDKRGIKKMLDLPSCVSVDFAKEHPEMMARGADGKEKVPQGWQDIRMLAPFINEQTRELNKPVLDMHKQYVDACIDLGFDGIRADVGRAKPVEFWNVIINYSRAKDPGFAWLAETYTHEDASPQLNMPYDRPQELLEVGFDCYYGQYHNYSDWLTNNILYSYIKENIEMSNKIGQPKSILGSFYTHDDRSPMLYGGAPWVSFVTALQGMIPQCCPYTTDGMPTGDLYIFPYDHAQVRDSETDCHECTVHTGRMDIFNKSRKPGGKSPEISEMMKASNAIRNGNYNEIIKPAEDKKLKMGAFAKDVITKGSFITLPSNNDEVISFARHKDGKTLIFIGNRNVNRKVGARIEIPGLKPEQKFNNLLPSQNNIQGRIQNNKDGSITVELDANKACVFEIDDANIQKLSKPENILQQKYLN